MFQESDALHARVRAFIEDSVRLQGGEVAIRPERDARRFEALAVEIARFQVRHVPAVRRLLAARGLTAEGIGDAAAIPAVPTEVFRLARVAAHPASEDVAVFRTSGTTSGARGEHALRTLATYDAAAFAWGAAWLFEGRSDFAVISLTPPPGEAADSSLVHMIDLFARAQAGPVTWHLGGGALDVAGVERACQDAREAGREVLLFGTSFAFVHLMDAASGADLRLPEGSRAMLTGGFKGRSREVPAAELRAAIAGAFGIPDAAVVGEYGMTELSSQLYETTLVASRGGVGGRGEVGGGGAGAGGPALCTPARHDVYTAPPWVRVTAVDPETLAPVAAGEVGIARIVDLANVDSAVAIQTADRVRVTDEGVELLGRMPGATPRGCSLAVEEVLG